MQNPLTLLIIIPFLLALYVLIAGIQGYIRGGKAVCPAGYRAISIDGSQSLLPRDASDIVVPTADFPTCSPMLSCPVEGQQYAIQPDGSALTNQCASAGCPCTAFRHCPAYASTIFRQFGRDDRISYFQIIDPMVTNKDKPQDPYDPPYILFPGNYDSCFLSASTLDLLWEPIKLGDKCIQGTLAKMDNAPSLYVCAPTQYVTGVGDDSVFKVSEYLSVYRTK